MRSCYVIPAKKNVYKKRMKIEGILNTFPMVESWWRIESDILTACEMKKKKRSKRNATSFQILNVFDHADGDKNSSDFFYSPFIFLSIIPSKILSKKWFLHFAHGFDFWFLCMHFDIQSKNVSLFLDILPIQVVAWCFCRVCVVFGIMWGVSELQRAGISL